MVSVIITNREKSDDPRKNTHYLNLSRIGRVSHATAQRLRGIGVPIPEDMVGSVTATDGTGRSRLESDTTGGTREHSDGGSDSGSDEIRRALFGEFLPGGD